MVHFFVVVVVWDVGVPVLTRKAALCSECLCKVYRARLSGSRLKRVIVQLIQVGTFTEQTESLNVFKTFCKTSLNFVEMKHVLPAPLEPGLQDRRISTIVNPAILIGFLLEILALK